jgi:hypothetical protein
MNILIKSSTTGIRVCPKCDGQKVCRAHSVNTLDRLLSMVNIYPYRYRQFPCKSRFCQRGEMLKISKYSKRSKYTFKNDRQHQ